MLYKSMYLCLYKLWWSEILKVVVSYLKLVAQNNTWGLTFLQKYLVKQNELGFDEFREIYSNLAYTKVDSDEPAPDVEVTSTVLLAEML